ncbi:TIGR02099 family protein [Solimonas aquatica]|uniref:TIGR02099 family protein n=1 Tax=Solimonas aquatica TaxID=489703 RepID=A0A1H9M5W8_9GAMM|nr:YhdP family protein [Solimonas aquatica]SER19074.1 TIGR02099 family protein [Solimonas aquatica]
MERVKRRWWTWAISLLAGVVIVTTAISGLFQVAVLALPSYRADLSAWITRVADRPVQIGGINLSWRGLEPRLDLDDITLFSNSGEESLSAEHLSMGFNPLRLLTGNVFPDHVELSGISLSAERDAQGRWRIAGFGGGEDDPAWREALARDLKRFRHLRIQNCELSLSAPELGPQPQLLRLGVMELDLTSQGFALSGALHLPAAYGDLLELSADVEGPLAEPAQWHGDFELRFKRLQPQGWLRAWLPEGAVAAAQNLNLGIEGSFAQQRVKLADLVLDSGPLVLAQAGRVAQARRARLRGQLRGEADGAWYLDLRDLRLDDERLAHGAIRYRRSDAGGELDVDAAELRLGRIAPWFGITTAADGAARQLTRLSGNLRNLVLRLREDQNQTLRYTLTTQLEQLAFAAEPEQNRPGFSGLSGELSASDSGGSLRLQRLPLSLQLPGVMAQNVSFDSLSALLQWQRSAEGWHLAVPQLAWVLAGSSGDGRLSLELPAEHPHDAVLDLQARFSAQDVEAFKPFMPLHWPQHLRDYLQQSLKKGRVSHGELRIQGPLADFPYHQRPTGSWQLDLDALGVTLAFAPDWPKLEDVAAHLSFSGNSLSIEAQSLKIAGNPVRRALARFDDFDDGILRVSARTEGEIARYYDYLRATPLHERLSGLVDETRAAGSAAVDLDLTLPVHDIKSSSVQGTVSLDEVQLMVGRLEQPLAGISGSLRFDDQGVSADRLSARFEEIPLSVRIVPRAGTHGVVQGDFSFSPDADGRGASALIPAFLRPMFKGESAWHAELPIQDGNTALYLSSDLRGTDIQLPEPLGKSAELAAPLNLRIGGKPELIGFNYAQKLSGALLLGSGEQGQSLDGLHLRFGADSASPPQRGQYFIDGHADTADLATWIPAIAGMSGTGGGAPQIESLELDVDHLRWQHQLSEATHLRYRPQNNGWQITLSGEGAQGTIDWQGPAPGRLTARLDRLRVRPQTPPGEAEAASADKARSSEPPLDPTQWPELDISCAGIFSGDTELGALTLNSARIAGGQRLDRFNVSGGIAELQAGGQWRRSEGRSTGELRFELQSRDIEALLKALDYAPSLSAKSSHANGQLRWTPAAGGLDWQSAAGKIELGAEDGQLRAVKPGASRVLGLINFYALPRRLTLNFSDVVDQGLAFDTISGQFDLGNGAANTRDLEIKGPSLRMQMHGRIGLAARDYDQYVTVYPGVSSGVTLGAALLGGPAVGALVLLAQEVLDKPLDQVTQLSYHLSGSWDNPKVERVDGRDARQGGEAKSGKTNGGNNSGKRK